MQILLRGKIRQRYHDGFEIWMDATIGQDASYVGAYRPQRFLWEFGSDR
jgi:hypothetical protein